MLSYELCKQLKDAGFPQEYQRTKVWMDWAYDDGGELHLLHEDNDTGWWIGNDYTEYEMSQECMENFWVKCPTLSELIEACGDKFTSLRQKAFEIWEATASDIVTRRMWNEGGETPEEAVAKLYLKLNNG